MQDGSLLLREMMNACHHRQCACHCEYHYLDLRISLRGHLFSISRVFMCVCVCVCVDLYIQIFKSCICTCIVTREGSFATSAKMTLFLLTICTALLPKGAGGSAGLDSNTTRLRLLPICGNPFLQPALPRNY